MIVAAGFSAAAVLPTVSGASPLDEKRRQATELSGQIAANDQKLVGLSEQLNGARYRRDQANEGIAEAQRRTDEAVTERRRVRGLLGRRAAEIYRHAGSATPLQQIDVSSLGEIAARSKYASAAADRDDQLIARLQKAEEDLAIRKADLERQRAAAEAEADAANAAREKLDAANRQAQALRGQVSGEIAALVRRGGQRTGRRHAACRRPTCCGTSQRRIDPFDDPAELPRMRRHRTPARPAAVEFAKAQVGKGYRYATSGPDTFDCSGLTAAAWQRGGVSLAHYSGAQYQQTIRIGSGDLQPGDLVFYGAGGSNHVEIYIGGGMVVSASNPSSGVKLAGVRYGSASGYGRVRA